MLRRREWLIGSGAMATVGPTRAATPTEVLSADIRPLSIAMGPRRGLVLDIVSEAFKSIGEDVRFTFLPFPEALKRTQAERGKMMAPLARSPQREADYAWIAKIIDVPQAMGTLAGKPVVDLDAARQLRRVGVVRAGVQESFLREQGFTNLVLFDSAAEIAKALASNAIDAWYATATEIVLQFDALGRSRDVQVGPPLQVAPVWLASNKDVTGVPAKQLQAAIVALDGAGVVERIYRSYVPR